MHPLSLSNNTIAVKDCSGTFLKGNKLITCILDSHRDLVFLDIDKHEVLCKDFIKVFKIKILYIRILV